MSLGTREGSAGHSRQTAGRVASASTPADRVHPQRLRTTPIPGPGRLTIWSPIMVLPSESIPGPETKPCHGSRRPSTSTPASLPSTVMKPGERWGSSLSTAMTAGASGGKTVWSKVMTSHAPALDKAGVGSPDPGRERWRQRFRQSRDCTPDLHRHCQALGLKWPSYAASSGVVSATSLTLVAFHLPVSTPEPTRRVANEPDWRPPGGYPPRRMGMARTGHKTIADVPAERLSPFGPRRSLRGGRHNPPTLQPGRGIVTLTIAQQD